MKNVKKRMLSALLALIASSAWADPVEWRVADGGNGHRYEYVGTSMSWEDAFAYAAGRGGYLATITSSQENDFIAALAPSTIGGWLGASDSATEGVWVWQNGPEMGQVLSYTNWYSGEPNNGNGNENHLVGNWWFWTNQWNDLNSNNLGYVGGLFIEYGVAAVPEPMPLPMAVAGLALVGGLARRSRVRQDTED